MTHADTAQSRGLTLIIGSGASGRNTTILRSNYKTPEGARFYDASVKLYEGLSAELNFNLLFSQRGHLTLRVVGDGHQRQPAGRHGA